MPPVARLMSSIEIFFDAPPSPLKASLRERLNASPAKNRSPSDLAEALAKQSERSEKLRSAHIDAVKDRAARDAARVAEAQARKLRFAATEKERIERKMHAADNKVAAKKEAAEAKRQADVAKRTALAARFHEARKAMDAAKAVAHAEALEREGCAASKHDKIIQAVQTKGAVAVKHAEAVVAALKETEREAADAAAARLNERLTAAEIRRELKAPTSPINSPPPSPKKVLQRVRNDKKVEAEMRDVAHREKMDKAEAKRVAFLEEKMAKATSLNLAKKDKAAAAAAAKKGTDAETHLAKRDLFGKLNDAAVAAETHRKLRAIGKVRPNVASVIIVQIKRTEPRAPPTALVARLSAKQGVLLATAVARHEGATERRVLLKESRMQKLGDARARRAAALERVRGKVAARVTALEARIEATAIAKAEADASKLKFNMGEVKRGANAAAARKAAEDARCAKGESDAARCTGAAERHGNVMRRIAKVGSTTARAAANKSRREALAAVIAERANACSERCIRAAAIKDATLADKVVKAKGMGALRSSSA